MIGDKHIVKYLRHELSEKETEEMIAWLKEDPLNQDFLFSMKEMKTLEDLEKTAREIDPDEEWQRLEPHLTGPRQRFHWRKAVSYAAAFLCVLILGWQGNDYWRNRRSARLYQVLETGVGQQVSLTLPDGSQVRLNACSRLTYPSVFSGNRREVNLQGEGSFRVVRSHGRPFTVNTASYRIRVLGTQFNVSAYPEEEKTVTTLKKGKVEIVSTEKDRAVLGRLEPGETLVFDNRTQEYRVERQSSMETVYAWQKNELVFEGTRLEDMQRPLYRRYGYRFRLAPEVKDLRYKATVRTESLTELLAILGCLTPEIRYRIDHDRQEVTIEKATDCPLRPKPATDGKPGSRRR